MAAEFWAAFANATFAGGFMPEKPKARPDGFHTVNSYLVVNGAAQLLDFLARAFGAEGVGEPFNSPGDVGSDDTE
jgi:hypothetical protein